MTAVRGRKAWAVVGKDGRIYLPTVATSKAKAIEKFGVEFDGYAPNGWTDIANGKAPRGYRCIRVTIQEARHDER